MSAALAKEALFRATPDYEDFDVRMLRSLQEDVKTAVDLAFDIKRKLVSLHPNAIEAFIKLVG